MSLESCVPRTCSSQLCGSPTSSPGIKSNGNPPSASFILVGKTEVNRIFVISFAVATLISSLTRPTPSPISTRSRVLAFTYNVKSKSWGSRHGAIIFIRIISVTPDRTLMVDRYTVKVDCHAAATAGQGLNFAFTAVTAGLFATSA